MAPDNKTIGRFQLDGIAPAPRGIPQVEVTFDIDANGILSVSAKDKATGKTQNVKIEVSSGLSESEIKKMKAEAKANEEEDKKKKEKVDLRNSADQAVFQTEKLLKDLEGKIDPADKQRLESSVSKLKEVLKTDDIEALKNATEGHNKIWHEISTKMAQASQGAGAGPGPQDFDPSQHQPKDDGKASGKDDVENADFEVVDDEK